MAPTLKFIGRIHTPYEHVDQCPNNIEFDGPMSEIKLDDQYKDGLNGLNIGERILVLYWLGNVDYSESFQGGDKGTFALRAPNRPNPIGAAIVPIEKMNNGSLFVRGLDCLNNTALLDIKPAIYNELHE